MYFSITLIPLSALVLHTTAVTIPRQNDAHITDFRTYGAPGCSADNQGVYTITTSGLNICQTFADPTIGSVFVVDITDGCSGELTNECRKEGWRGNLGTRVLT